MILSTILRSKATASLLGVAGGAVAQQYAQQYAQQSGTSNRTDRFNYDNILSRLSISENFEEVYSIYANNKEKFGIEHFSMMCRAIGRIYRKVGNIPNREAHQVLEKRIAEEIPKMNPQQCLDFLYMVRSLGEGSGLRIPNEQISEFFKRLNEFIEGNQYSFRNYISLYYDLALLNRLNKNIRQQLYDKLVEEIERGSLRNLSMFNLGLLLKAMGTLQELTFRDQQIYDRLVNYIETNTLYKETSIDEKANLFLNLARIYYNNDVQFPRFMKVLDEEFIEKMELLTDRSILSIIEASTMLPMKAFKVGDEIRKVLIDNMANDSKEATGIEPSFFLDCILKLTYGNRRHLSQAEVKKIVDYVLLQIPFKDKTNNAQNKLARLIINGNLFSNIDAQRILEKILKKSETVRLDELELATNVGMNVGAEVIRFYQQNQTKQEPMQLYKVVRLYMVLKALPEKELTERLQTIAKQINKEIEEILQKNWALLVVGARKSNLKDNLKQGFYNQILDKLETLKPEEITKENIAAIFSVLIKASTNRQIVQRVNQFIEKHREKLRSTEFRKWLELAIRENSDSNYYSQLLTICELAELGSARMVYLLKETDLIKSSQRFTTVLNRLTKLVADLFKVPTSRYIKPEDAEELPEANTSEKGAETEAAEDSKAKSPFTWSHDFDIILKKFDSVRVDTPLYRGILKGISMNPVVFPSRRNAQYLTEQLHYKGLLNKQKAENIKQSISEQTQNLKGNKMFFEFLLDSAISSQALPTNFNFEPLRANKLSLLLQYPTQLYKDKLPAILEYTASTESRPHEWFNLVMSLRKPKFESRDFQNIASSIFHSQLNNYSKSMRHQDFVMIARRASQVGVGLPKFWQRLYGEISDRWEELTFNDRLSTLSELTSASVDVSKHIKMILTGLHDKELNLFADVRNRLLRLFSESNTKLSTEEFADIEKIVNSAPLNQEESVNFLKLLACNPQIDKAASLVKSTYANLGAQSKEQLQGSLLFEYLSKKYPDSGVVFKINEPRLLFTTPMKEVGEIKAYFDKASQSTGLPVEYQRTENGHHIDVVFNNHRIRLANKAGLFFARTGRPTLFGYLFKSILELDLKNPVVLINSRWFANDENKFERLKTEIPELEKYPALKDLDKSDTKQKGNNKIEEEEDTIEEEKN